MVITKDTKKRVNPSAPAEINGVRYPSYPLELLEEIPDPVPPSDDVTFYVYQEHDEEPYSTWTRKSEEEIQAIQQERLNQKSLAYLASTDWMAIRAAEGGTPMSDEVKAARQAARDAIVQLVMP